MAFHRATNWKDRMLQMQAVKDKCNEILGNLNLPEEDVRALAIVQVRQCCNTLAAVPIKLCQSAEVNSNVPAMMTLLGVSRPDDLKSCLDDLNRNARISFVTVVQFALENCIERVLDAIATQKALGSFSKSSRRLIDLTELEDPSSKHDILMVPAWIRNTLHAGGVHSRRSKTVLIDGEPYEFQQGKRVECASWSHLFHAFHNALGVYQEILCSPSVVSIGRIDVA